MTDRDLALDVVAQDGAVSVVPVGRDRGHFAEVFAREIDRPFTGPELLEKRPVGGYMRCGRGLSPLELRLNLTGITEILRKVGG